MDIVVAYDESRAIGRNNELLWEVGEMKEDMKRFRSLTLEKTVIMGRKTLESINNTALPRRRNIVVSTSLDVDIPNIEIARTFEEAYDFAGGGNGVFVIGGQQLYQSSLEAGVVDTIFATEVQAAIPDADRYFPDLATDQWKETERIAYPADQYNLYDYEFVKYERK